MKFSIISLFPELFHNYFNYGVISRAINKQLVDISYYNPRDYSDCKHGTVDDKPFGGGAGMVLKPDPVVKSIRATKNEQPDAKVVYLTPQGKLFKQTDAKQLVKDNSSLIFLSGRYEGVDERVISNHVDYEYSIGDYVLTGGELPAMVMIDAITRLIPGVLGDAESFATDSFSTGLNGLLEYPQYTRPYDFEGEKVPEVLLSGNHKDIANWRLKQSLGRTWLRRPNLLKYVNLTEYENKLLLEFKQEYLGR